MRKTLYAKIVLTFGLTYYTIFFVVVFATMFLLNDKLIITNVLEVIGAATALTSLIVNLLGKKWSRLLFATATLLIVVSQLIGAGLVLWANCVIELFVLFLVVLLRL